MIQKTITLHNGTPLTVDQAAEGWKELKDRTDSDEQGYNSIGELAPKVKNLEENQVTGHKVYPTLGDFPPVGEDLGSYKAADTGSFYRWDTGTTTYIKDGDSQIQTDLNAEVAKNLDREAILVEGMDSYTHAKRVKDDGGETCDIITLDTFIRLNRQYAKIALKPHSTKVSKVYSQIPVNGDSDFEFNRLSEASYKDKDGLIKIATNNQPRLEYDDNADPYLLLEPQATNYCIYSKTLRNDLNVAVGGGDGSGFVERNVTIAPDGTLTASRFSGSIIDTTNNANYALLNIIDRANSFVISKKCISIWLKSNTNQNQFVTLYSNRISSTGAAFFEVTPEWKRFTLSGEYTGSATGFSSLIGVRGSSGYFAGDSTIDISFWNCNMVTGLEPGSDIFTNGSIATRVLDNMQKLNISDLLTGNEIVLSFKATPIQTDSGTYRISLSDGTADNRVSFAFDNNTKNGYSLVVIDGVQILFNLFVNLGDTTLEKEVTIVVSSGDSKIYVDGQEQLSSISNFNYLPLDRLKIDGASVDAPFYGKLKELRVFNVSST